MNDVRSIDKLALNKGCCTQCKHDERLLSNTIFQDNKLPLNVLLYGLFLIFTAKKESPVYSFPKNWKWTIKSPICSKQKLESLWKTRIPRDLWIRVFMNRMLYTLVSQTCYSKDDSFFHRSVCPYQTLTICFGVSGGTHNLKKIMLQIRNSEQKSFSFYNSKCR